VEGEKNMASKTLGRIDCPIGCGHKAAQVKLKTDKEEGKTAYPYVHCAGCGIQLHTRNEEQAGHLLRSTRPEKGVEPHAPASAAPGEPEPSPAPPAPRSASPLFDGLFAGGTPA
jgi:hypothetical protein